MTALTPGVVLVSVLAGVALAAAAGLRAFLPLLAVGIGARLGLIHPHEGFAFLGSNAALIALAVAAVLEMTADKIPLVDHLLDLASGFVRPAAGFLAAMAVMGDLPDAVAVSLALVLAVLTLGTHVVHAKTRLGSTVATAGFGNPVLSFFEDLVSGVVSALAVLAPLLAGVLVLGVAYFLWRGLGRRRNGNMHG